MKDLSNKDQRTGRSVFPGTHETHAHAVDVQPFFENWLANHDDRQLADFALDVLSDPNFPVDDTYQAMSNYVRYAIRLPEADLILFEVGVESYNAFLWRHEALARLRQLVGDADARVLAVEAALECGQVAFADDVLLRELCAIHRSSDQPRRHRPARKESRT